MAMGPHASESRGDSSDCESTGTRRGKLPAGIGNALSRRTRTSPQESAESRLAPRPHWQAPSQNAKPELESDSRGGHSGLRVRVMNTPTAAAGAPPRRARGLVPACISQAQDPAACNSESRCTEIPSEWRDKDESLRVDRSRCVAGPTTPQPTSISAHSPRHVRNEQA